MSDKVIASPNRVYTADALIQMRKNIWENSDKADRDKNDREFRENVGQMIVNGQMVNGVPYRNLYAEVIERPEKLIEMVMCVVDKKKDLRPFFLNEVQRELADIIYQARKDYDEGRRNHLKFLVLKGRQQGFTTFISAYNLAVSITNANTEALTLADCDENTTDIFQKKAKHPFGLIPDILKPEKKYDNRRELMFQNEAGTGLNSSWRVVTATKDIGRSKTLNILHGSEVAFWIDAEEILTAGLKEALTEDCLTFLESTANGNNYYKDLWDGDNNWECLFFQWWKTSEYRMRFESVDKEMWFKNTVSKAEKGSDDAETSSWAFSRCRFLIEEIHLDWNQVYWYYTKWKDSREKIKQEYPCSAKEAFLASGNRYFNVENTERRTAVLKKKYEKNPPERGYFTFKRKYDPTVDRMVIDKKTIELIYDEQGIVEFYEKPSPGKKYAFGGDTAGDGSDNNAGQIVDTDRVQKAELICQYDEDLFAEQAICLAYYYNTAMIAIETNFSTHPIKVVIDNMYPNIYVREAQEDSVTGKIMNKFGWVTSSKTRTPMFSEVRTIVREEVEKINSVELLDEMTTVIKDDRGRPDHEQGKHDDRVVSYGVACQAIYQVIEPLEIGSEKETIKGYKTVDELEDMGYSEQEIEDYLEYRKSFDQVTVIVDKDGRKEYHGDERIGGISEPDYLEDLFAEENFDNAEGW